MCTRCQDRGEESGEGGEKGRGGGEKGRKVMKEKRTIQRCEDMVHCNGTRCQRTQWQRTYAPTHTCGM